MISEVSQNTEQKVSKVFSELKRIEVKENDT